MFHDTAARVYRIDVSGPRIAGNLPGLFGCGIARQLCVEGRIIRPCSSPPTPRSTATCSRAHSHGETFPITRLFGKVCARSNWHIKDLHRVAPVEPHIVFGKVPNNTAVSV